MIQSGLCSLEDGGLKMDRPEKFPARTEFIKTGMVEALIGVQPLDNSSSLKDIIWTIKCLSPNLIEAVLFFQLVRQLAQLESTVLTYSTYGPVDWLAAASESVWGILAQTRIIATLGKIGSVFFFLIGTSSLASTGISTRTLMVL